MKSIIRISKILVQKHFRSLTSIIDTFTMHSIRLLEPLNNNYKEFIFLKETNKRREIGLYNFFSLLKEVFCMIGENFVV